MKTAKLVMLLLLISLLSVTQLFCSSKTAHLETIKNFDLKRYSGTWYEIARLPNRFEKGLVCVTAEYQLMKDGRIKVTNRGRKEKNTSEGTSAAGVAWVPDPAEPGKLKVSFFWPFSGDYWILKLDQKEYRYVLVGDQSRKYLWILARTPSIEKEVHKSLADVARERGFPTEKLYLTPQNCCQE